MNIEFDYYARYSRFSQVTQYWFTPVDRTTFMIYDLSSAEPTTAVSRLHLHDGADHTVFTIDTEGFDSDVLSHDWAMYRERPEYLMLHPSEPLAESSAELSNRYDECLIGSVCVKEFKASGDPDNATNLKRIDKCIAWLHNTDFYEAPASTQYHDSQPQGLLIHSLNVCNRAIDLCTASVFHATVHIENAIFVSLVHDWCKIGLYEQYYRNVKDEATGQWHKESAYKYVKDRAICLGHGTSSLYLVMKFFHVSIDVAAAIRHHMGRWNCVEAEINELQQANRNYPLVHLIQFADQLAIVNY